MRIGPNEPAHNKAGRNPPSGNSAAAQTTPARVADRMTLCAQGMAEANRITLRPSGDADHEFCYQVKKAALGSYIEAVWGWDESFQRDFHSRDWQTRRPDIIVYDGSEIGTIQFVKHHDRFHLGEFYILPAQQRQGIGSFIVEWMIEQSDSRQLAIYLEVLQVNPARRFYERFGFCEYGKTETHYLMKRQPAQANAGSRPVSDRLSASHLRLSSPHVADQESVDR